jgi:hypothetical protein
MAPDILSALGILGAQWMGAAGTRIFEPDGVVFCALVCLAWPAQPPPVSRQQATSTRFILAGRAAQYRRLATGQPDETISAHL